MRGKASRYTFVVEFLGGTYVRQGSGLSPDLALCTWLQRVSDDEFEWSEYRKLMLEQLAEHNVTPVEGCKNVWCFAGCAGEHLFLIHIVGTESGSAAKQLAAAASEQAGIDSRRWGFGDRW